MIFPDSPDREKIGKLHHIVRKVDEHGMVELHFLKLEGLYVLWYFSSRVDFSTVEKHEEELGLKIRLANKQN